MAYSRAIVQKSVRVAETACGIRKAFGDDAGNDEVARFWFRRLKYGNESIEDKQRQGCLETSSNEEFKWYIFKNYRATCSEIGQGLNCDETIVEREFMQ